MRKILIISLLLFFTLNIVIAQESAVKVSSKYNDNKSVTFNYEKTDPGNQTLVLDFKTLNNTMGATQQSFNLLSYSGTFLTLTPSNKEQNISFSYSYRYIRGKLKPKYNADFLYTLPYKSGTEVRVSESGFIGSMYFGNTTPEDWKVYRFYTKDEDTVTAIRKGIVVAVKDLYNTFNSDDVAYSSSTNEVIVEHADGTLATYRGFKKGIAVKVGQTVFPGTALGLNSRLGSKEQYYIVLLVTYLKSIEFQDSKIDYP